MKKILALLLLVGFIWVTSSFALTDPPLSTNQVQPSNGKTYTIPGMNDGGTIAAFNKKLYNFTKNTIHTNGRIIFQAFEVTENDRVVAIRYDGTIRAWVIWEDYKMGLNGHKGNYVLFDKDCNGTYETRIDSHESFIYPECYKK